MKQHRNIFYIILIILVAGVYSSCGVYSFTGASIPAEAKTVSIQYFPNRALLIEPTLSSIFTNTLRDQFTNQTNLEMIEHKGDLAIEGEVVDYKITPVAIQADQTAAQNRLTIVINARFTNKFEPDKDFEQKFSQFLDYGSTVDFNSVKSQLIDELSENIAQDIFDKAVINW
jgi:lipopolysaccharide assembly LptE-like protein